MSAGKVRPCHSTSLEILSPSPAPGNGTCGLGQVIYSAWAVLSVALACTLWGIWQCPRMLALRAPSHELPLRRREGSRPVSGTWALAHSFLFSLGGGLAPEMPPRRGKPQPLLPPLLGPSGGDREPMGLGPPASQLTPPPAPVGLRGSSHRGLPKDSGPLPTPPGVRSYPASSLPCL